MKSPVQCLTAASILTFYSDLSFPSGNELDDLQGSTFKVKCEQCSPNQRARWAPPMWPVCITALAEADRWEGRGAHNGQK
jgi:hypothetical protein